MTQLAAVDVRVVVGDAWNTADILAQVSGFSSLTSETELHDFFR